MYIAQLLVLPNMLTGWIAVQREVYIDYDLDNFPLYIRTDSVVGSKEWVWMKFYTAQGVHSGGLVIYFRFFIFKCESIYQNLGKFF